MFQKILAFEDTAGAEFEKKKIRIVINFKQIFAIYGLNFFLNVSMFLIFTNILIKMRPKVNRAQSLYLFKSDAVLSIGANWLRGISTHNFNISALNK